MRTGVGRSSLLLGSTGLVVLVGCTVPYTGGEHAGEDFSDGHVYVTKMLGDGCVYDAAAGGIVFEFELTGHKDADMVAEVHRARPGADVHHPGPVIASERWEIRDGRYDNPLRIVVPLAEADYDPDLTRCILQTENHGPDVVRVG